MYEFIRTKTGWLLYWGPPPRPAHPAPTRPKPPPQAPDGCPDDRDSAAHLPGATRTESASA